MNDSATIFHTHLEIFSVSHTFPRHSHYPLTTPSPRRMISLVMEKNIKKSPRAVFDLIDGIIFECMERKSKMKINFKMVG